MRFGTWDVWLFYRAHLPKSVALNQYTLHPYMFPKRNNNQDLWTSVGLINDRMASYHTNRWLILFT